MVGGGQIASRKVAGLLAAGARVTVVAPMVSADAGRHSGARCARARPTRSADIAGHLLVMTATDDPAVNAQVASDARRAGVWVNSADDPDNCSFILPAVARRGPVVVAVGTDGASPALARHLRDRIAPEILTPAGGGRRARAGPPTGRAPRGWASAPSPIDWTDRVRTALGLS